MSAMRPRRVPFACVTSGSCCTAARRVTGGASRSMACSSGSRSSRLASASSIPSFCWIHSTGASARSRAGWVKSMKIRRRCSRSRRGRGALRSICGRARSISFSYWTPDGQAVTQAMQPRQRSRCRRISSDASEPSSLPTRMSTMRPRGESISSSKIE